MQSLTRSTSLQLLIIGALFMLAPAAHAQIKPYFLVDVDTSGSMAWCAGGQPDASNTASCACFVDTAVYGAGTFGNPYHCQGAMKTNVCGFGANRIGDAKCALQRIIDGTGDATFGLMQFEHPCSATCADTPGGAVCDAQLVVEIKNNNANLMREWVDGRCNRTPSDAPAGTATCATEGFTHELTTGQGTPIGQSLVRANEYLRGLVASGGAWKYPTNPAGFNQAVKSPLVGDSSLACRPVSVILLTDGVESCNGNGQAAATALRAGTLNAGSVAGKGFRTYVIGFGSGGGNFDPTALDNIAMAGGTNAMSAGNHRYFLAANEPELSVALNQIIADAQAPIEICNGADDDCDGKIDEGLTKYCNDPGGHTKADLCNDPGETKCDGKDDNCDGLIDNGFAGVCSTCTSSDKEVCDGVDNDCDGKIDEDTNTLAPCGSDQGTCKPGQLECIAGQESCEGGVLPAKETCDCADNDCDGNVDEDASGTDLCGDNMRCAGCQCVSFCEMTSEFTASCKGGLTAEFQANGECLCVHSDCDAKACAKQTVKVAGKAVCAPTDARLGTCLCRGGACAARCDGVTCASGEACNPRSGQCVENNCRGLGCDSGKLCEPVSGMCQLDACVNAGCSDTQVCRDGKCEASCAGITCANGQLCVSGKCKIDKCATVSCTGGKACSADLGKCVKDACAGVVCGTGQSCDVAAGKCIANPCWDVTCPSSQVCMQGECVFGGSNPVTAAANDNASSRLLAAGGGGCACSVPGTERSGRLPPMAAAIALMLCGVLLRRRRAGRGLRRYALWALAAVLMVFGAGCRVTPFCVDCAKSSSGSSGSGGASDAGKITLEDGRVIDPGKTDAGSAQGGTSGSGDTDAGDGMPHCKKTGPETCNGKDDDCDFKVDEDTSATTNDCLQAGVCAHTKPVCVAGKFVCHYVSTFYQADETLCDGKDNDCDGMVDEPFPKLGEPCQVGVGECRVNGSLECKATGLSLTCVAGALKKPSAELCDGKDNDCDGLVDEPMSNKGSNPFFVDQGTVAAEVCDGIDNDCDGKIDEPKSDKGSNPSFVPEDVVQVNGSLWIYKYEASRVDATATSDGKLAIRPCSRAGVLPWSNITYGEAEDACAQAGMTLCNVNDWITSCQAGVAPMMPTAPGTCGWAYTPSSGTCNDYQTNGSTACIGHDVTAQPGSADTDALAVTGSKAQCYANDSGGHVFDLSGNLKEWTTDPGANGSPTQNPLRGGSYNNAPAGMRCDFDFAVGGPTLRLPTIGFRCCSATNPN